MLARESRRSRELVVVAREEERRQLRRDLHDGVGPSIASLALQVETARDLAAEDPEAAVALLARLAPRINAVVGDVRALVHELRPPTLDELGLTAAVRELAARLSGTTAVTVESDDLGALPAAVEVATYRITGEAVTNAVRHSGATAVTVSLARDEEALLVTVRDDGHGLGPPNADGVGLGSMRARTEELGGTFTFVTGETGTTVTARLPVQDVDRDDRRTA
jgi:signal transduction histidine kinase